MVVMSMWAQVFYDFLVLHIKNIVFFELPGQNNVYFDMPQVYSAIMNHRIHLTTFFMLMTTI